MRCNGSAVAVVIGGALFYQLCRGISHMHATRFWILFAHDFVHTDTLVGTKDCEEPWQQVHRVDGCFTGTARNF